MIELGLALCGDSWLSPPISPLKPRSFVMYTPPFARGVYKRLFSPPHHFRAFWKREQGFLFEVILHTSAKTHLARYPFEAN